MADTAPNSRWRPYAAACAIFALDRLTKSIVESRVTFYDSLQVIPGFFDIVHSQNRGVAFGIFNDAGPGWTSKALLAITSAAVVIISVILWRARNLEPRSRWGLALILGGAAGNVFDRLVAGQVTDFLLFHAGRYEWPAFNIADSAIVVGSALVALDALLPKRQAANVP